MSNLLKTAVSVLASTVKLTVSFMEPLVTVSVMLRCSQQVAGSSSGLDGPPSFWESEGGADALVSSQPSQSERQQNKKRQKWEFLICLLRIMKGSLHTNVALNGYSRNLTFMPH